MSLGTRYVVLSMDVEDWYHLDYFQKEKCETSYSLLDGVEQYLKILEDEHVPSSFFAVGELSQSASRLLKDQSDIGAHTWSHKRPLTLSTEEFRQDLIRTKAKLEDTLGRKVRGFRAPCFSLDRDRLAIVQEAGFDYDSSYIRFSEHPLYGALDLSDFEVTAPQVFKRGTFFEFEISTVPVLGHAIPISGGGYLRLLPWVLTKRLITSYLKTASLYVLYVHPFELSTREDPPFPRETGSLTRLRFSKGRKTMATRVRGLIHLLRTQGCVFSTFAEVREILLSNRESV